MGIIIDGKKLSNEIMEELKLECKELKSKGIFPKFAVIMVGNNEASKVYVRNKSKACDEIGIEYEEYLLEEKISQNELINLIKELNDRKDINGILLQSPIPEHLDINEAFRTISYQKDVDGFNPTNVGRLMLGQNTLVSCTPYGIMKIFEKYKIDLNGKHVVILGRSNIVGKPLSACCLNNNATVTICHSKTKNLEKFTKEADILVAAIGKSKFVTKEMLKKGVIVIDVGINRGEDGKLSGDVDYESVKDIASYITPVPGGVGPMTISMLMNNVIKATKEQNKK